MKKVLLIFTLFLFHISLNAQDANDVPNEVPNIVTDRPGQSDAAVTVGDGNFQIETGTQLNIEGSIENWTILGTLLKYGIGNKFELRVLNSLNRTPVFYATGPDTYQFQASDLELGMKYNILNQSSIQLATVAHLILPLGTTSSGDINDVGFTTKLLASVGLNDRLGVSSNLIYSYGGQGNGDLGYTLILSAALNDKVSFFSELYGTAVGFKDLSYNYDMGFAYLFSPTFQVDFSFGFNLGKEARLQSASSYYALGASWRIDK